METKIKLGISTLLVYVTRWAFFVVGALGGYSGG